jgi:hypothetical protein
MDNKTTASLRPFYRYQWLDVLDCQDKWYVAQIILGPEQTLNKDVRVHYFGWKNKYDETLDGSAAGPHAHRFAPLHTHTQPLAKKLDPAWRPNCEVGEELLVLDSLSNWVPAMVKQVDTVHDLVKIHYIGWINLWDEFINCDSYRLRPAPNG